MSFDYRLKKGDKVEVLDEIKLKQKSNIKSNKKDLPVEMVHKIKQSVVFEDENVLVLNKPYGISVQGGTGVKHSLVDFFPILSDKNLRIVHRIDKDTSGILLLAKNLQTAEKLKGNQS